jgi:hypothetical protein
MDINNLLDIYKNRKNEVDDNELILFNSFYELKDTEQRILIIYMEFGTKEASFLLKIKKRAFIYNINKIKDKLKNIYLSKINK